MTDETKVVATGTWYYDGVVPKRISVCAKPARLSSARYDSDDQLNESQPIPITPDGFIYKCLPSGEEGRTLEEAKALADAQPWGPVIWD